MIIENSFRYETNEFQFLRLKQRFEKMALKGNILIRIIFQYGYNKCKQIELLLICFKCRVDECFTDGMFATSIPPIVVANAKSVWSTLKYKRFRFTDFQCA